MRICWRSYTGRIPPPLVCISFNSVYEILRNALRTIYECESWIFAVNCTSIYQWIVLSPVLCCYKRKTDLCPRAWTPRKRAKNEEKRQKITWYGLMSWLVYCNWAATELIGSIQDLSRANNVLRAPYSEDSTTSNATSTRWTGTSHGESSPASRIGGHSQPCVFCCFHAAS